MQSTDFVLIKNKYVLRTEVQLNGVLVDAKVIVRSLRSQYPLWLFEIEVDKFYILIAAKRLYGTRDEAMLAAKFAVASGYVLTDGIYQLINQFEE
jgi:hypothetical protein